MTGSKIMTPAEAIHSLLKPGMKVAVGGMHMHNNPMTLVREVIKQRIPIGTLVLSPSASIGADLLIGAGLVEEVLAPYIGFEYLGLAPCFRRAVQEGTIKVRECETSLIINGLRAGAAGLPFAPVAPGVERTSIPGHNPEDYKWITDPFTGEKVLCTPAINPDIALVHCPYSDEEGNAIFTGSVFSDWDMIRASRRAIIQVEKVWDSDGLLARSRMGVETSTCKLVPGLFVDAIVEAPRGCHPTSSHGEHKHDEDHLKKYIRMARTKKGLEAYIERYVDIPEDPRGYMEQLLIPDRYAHAPMTYVPEAEERPSGTEKTPRYATRAVEIMVSALSRELKDGEVAIMGASSSIPLLACIVAKATHAPSLTYISGGSGAFNPVPEGVPLSSCDAALLKASSVLELGDLIDTQVQRGADVFFAGGLQVDRNGNLNLIGVGEHGSPRFRGPGTAGLSLFNKSKRIVIYMTNHTPRQFVEKVDHISGAGRPVNNVTKVITPLGIFDFDQEGDLRISSLHLGIEASDVIKNTGFPVGEEKEYPRTPLPSDEELKVMEELDPERKVRDQI
jgi:acyl CoA:acetate/3-ketoacid CoA transferase alpha subunit/acyl CoA:acetate/3-ketoacid CoA transferase beta subunit